MLPARRFNGQLGLTDFFNDFFENKSLDKIGTTVPAINVMENDKEYKIEVAAPGMCKDDFKVHLNKDGNLVIEMEKTNCGCKGKNEDKKECKYLRKEFSYSKFSQTLLLPDDIDKEGIEAHVCNGILKIRIKKTEKPLMEDQKKVSLLLDGLGSTQLVTTMDQGDLTCELGQVHSFLNSGVAAADNEYLEVFEEVSIAGSAEGNALTNELALVLAADGTGECTSSQDDDLAFVLALSADQLLDGTFELDFLNGIRNPVAAELGSLLAHALDQRGAGLAFNDLAGVVFNFIGDGDLTAILTLFDDQGLQAATASIQASSQTGGAGTQDNNVINIVHWNHSYIIFRMTPRPADRGGSV